MGNKSGATRLGFALLLKFRKVILADVGFLSPAQQTRLDGMDPSERADAELRRRSLEYVAATRARDELVVLKRS